MQQKTSRKLNFHNSRRRRSLLQIFAMLTIPICILCAAPTIPSESFLLLFFPSPALQQQKIVFLSVLHCNMRGNDVASIGACIQNHSLHPLARDAKITCFMQKCAALFSLFSISSWRKIFFHFLAIVNEERRIFFDEHKLYGAA